MIASFSTKEGTFEGGLFQYKEMQLREQTSWPTGRKRRCFLLAETWGGRRRRKRSLAGKGTHGWFERRAPSKLGARRRSFALDDRSPPEGKKRRSGHTQLTFHDAIGAGEGSINVSSRPPKNIDPPELLGRGGGEEKAAVLGL